MNLNLHGKLLTSRVTSPQQPTSHSEAQSEKNSILFLDQSGKPGGAELFLLDIAKRYRDRCLVCLFSDGDFRTQLEQQNVLVQVLAHCSVRVRKESGWWAGLQAFAPLMPLIQQVVQISQNYDLIYANTQKALVVGAIASLISRRPLIYHLHDILSPEHFSATNLRLAVTLANRFATHIIATSHAAKTAFIQAGGQADRVSVVYNGFDPQKYLADSAENHLRESLNLKDKFVVGHFSRLSPWKGQHLLIQALADCSEDTVAVFVGDALYGEQSYVESLKQQVQQLDLQNRVYFLGFQSNVVPLMHSCDVIAHTSTAPEPFGRVIVEAMLCDRPVIAPASGGAVEVVESGVTGWLVPPNDPQALATAIVRCRAQPEAARAIAQRARVSASQRFHIDTIYQQIDDILNTALNTVDFPENQVLKV